MIKTTVPFTIKNCPAGNYSLQLYAAGDGFFTFENQFLTGGETAEILEDARSRRKVTPVKFACTNSAPNSDGTVTVTVPSVSVAATSDLGNTQARYALAEVVGSSGRRIVILTDFIVPAELSSPVTWQQIEFANPPKSETDGSCSHLLNAPAGIDYATAAALVASVAAQANNAALAASGAVVTANAAQATATQSIEILNQALIEIGNLEGGGGGSITGDAGDVIVMSRVAAISPLLSYSSDRRMPLVGVCIEYENPIRQLADVVVEASLNNRSLGTVLLPRYQAEQESIPLWDATTKFWINCDENLYPNDQITATIQSGDLGAETRLRTSLYSALPSDILADPQLHAIRHHRRSGPLSNDTFPTQTTYIVRGNGIRYDPLGYPQNNSNIHKDPTTGEYWQFTSIWTRDEANDMYIGSSRAGATCELYGFKGTPIAGGSGGGVVIDFTDTFDRANTALGEGTYNRLDNGWTASGSTRGNISGNRALLAHHSTATIANAPLNGSFERAEILANTNVSFIVSTPIAGSAGEIQLFARKLTDQSAYRFDLGTNGTSAVYRRAGGVDVRMGATFAASPLQNDNFELDVTGGRVRVFLTRSGVRTTLFDQTDATPLPPGLGAFGANNVDFYVDVIRVAGTTPVATGSLDANGLPVIEWTAMGKAIARIPISPQVDDQNIYVGDPKLFVDLNGKCCISYNTADGTTDLVDFTKLSLKIRRADTFAQLFDGQTNQTFTVFTRLRTAAPAVFCVRLVPRPSKNDYLMVFTALQQAVPSYSGRETRILALSDYTAPLPDAQITNAKRITRNCCEGGNVWAIKDRVFISEWQNMQNQSNSGAMCVASAPIDKAETNPELWTRENGWYHNDPDTERLLGGVTADAVHYWYDKDTDDLWITFNSFSTNESSAITGIFINYTNWSRTKYANLHKRGTAIMGITKDPLYMPVRGGCLLDVPVKTNQTLIAKFTTGTKFDGGFYLVLGAESTTLSATGGYQLYLATEATGGTNAVQWDNGNAAAVTPVAADVLYTPNTAYDLRVEKRGALLILYSGNVEAGRYTITDAQALLNLKNNTCRWKILASAGTRLNFTDLKLI